MFPRLFLLLAAVLTTVPASLPASADYSMNEVSAEWSFPQLRSTWRQMLRWSAEEPLTTPTVTTLRAAAAGKTPSLAMVAVVSAHDRTTTPILEKDRIDTLRREAVRVLAHPNRRWGGEPILTAFLDVTAGIPPEEPPRYLLSQFVDDDIVGNAFASAALYLVGLQEQPDLFVPPLFAAATPPAHGGFAQEEIISANLLLTWAVTSQQALREYSMGWWYAAGGGIDPQLENLHALPAGECEELYDIAFRWSVSQVAYGTGLDWDHVPAGNHRMAWVILGQGEPLAERHLARIIRESPSWHDKRRALAVIAIRRPALFVNPAYSDLYARVISDRQGYGPGHYQIKRLGSLLRVPPPIPASEEEGDCHMPDMLYDLVEFDPWKYAPGGVPRGLAPYRETLLRQLRNALKSESRAVAQINLCHALLAANDNDAWELVAQYAVSNLENDDVPGNAVSSLYLLDDMDEQAVDAAWAGFEVGISMGDWQMVKLCAEYLAHRDVNFKYGEHPAAIRLMVGQLRDDDVPGNASAARRYLRLCGEAARPMLEQARQSNDEQQRLFAEELLGALDRRR